MSESITAVTKSRGKKKKKKKAWSHSAGPYGFRIRIFENPKSGIITGEMRDSSRPCGYRSVVLRHPYGVPFTRDEAIAWAHEQSGVWQKTKQQIRDEIPRLGRILSLYATHRTPRKSSSERQGDERRAELWTRFLGREADLSQVELKDAESFIEQRRSGAIDPRGNLVALEDQLAVSDSCVGDDLLWLRAVIAWALRWRENGHFVMRGDNPTRGWPIPKNKNVRRPVATTDRYEALRAVSDQVMMTIGRGKKAAKVRSYFSELLDLAYCTGRRISAIRQLKFEDLKLKEGQQ